MPGMNGTMCPHASGEGPDSLAAVGPNEQAPTERAPTTGPLAPAGKPAVTTPAPKPAAPKPLAQAPKAPTQVTKPTTRVTQPATQVQTQRPAATTAQSMRSVPKPIGRAVATTTVTTPSRPAHSHAKGSAPHRLAHQQRVAERSFERRFNGLEARAAKPSASAVDPIAVTARPAVAERPFGLPAGLLLGLLAVAGITVGLLIRRRGAGGAAAVGRPGAPIAPTYADSAMEAELHEMISEARARELLAPGVGEEESDRGESVGTR